MTEILLYGLIDNRIDDHDLWFIGVREVNDPSDMDELEKLIDSTQVHDSNGRSTDDCLAFVAFPRESARQIDKPENRGEVVELKSYELWIGESCGQRYSLPSSRGKV